MANNESNKENTMYKNLINFLKTRPKLIKCLKIALPIIVGICLVVIVSMYMVDPGGFYGAVVFFAFAFGFGGMLIYSLNCFGVLIGSAVIIAFSIILFGGALTSSEDSKFFNDYMYKTYVGKVTRTRYPIETSLERISCTSVNKVTKKFKVDSVYDAFEYHNLFWKNYFKGTLISSNKSVYKIISTVPINDTLKINGLSCKDTISTVNSIPYNDRNFNLIQINKKYINNKFNFIDTTYYKNISPKINNDELYNIFNNWAKFTYDYYVSKYTIKFIDETTIDTLNTFSEAEEKRNSKCKAKATLIKFNYSEYDACIKNNNIEGISIASRKSCGMTKIKISYNDGIFANTPYNCLDRINVSWDYSNFF